MPTSLSGCLAVLLIVMALVGYAVTGTATPPRAASVPQHCRPGMVRAYSGINMDGQRFICVQGYYPESQEP